MSVNITFDGVTYPIPVEGDSGWGTVVTNYLTALSTGTMQKSGGSFPLTSEVDFGNSFGLKALYFKSKNSNPSGTGIVRLGNAESIGWRNAANTADLLLSVDATDALVYNGNVLQGSVTVSDTTTVDLTFSSNDISAIVKASSLDDSHIANAAAIAYTKLSLSNSIVNADISASAAIAYSKLTLSNSILNSDISSSAAISLSKLAALTASKALVSDASGVVSTSAVTATELGYLAGVTSLVQAQINSKADASTTTGHIGASSGVHGISGSVVGTSDVQNITNKKLIGGIASSQNLWTVPGDTKANLTALARSTKAIYYATDENKYYGDNGSALIQLGGGLASSNTVINLTAGANFTISTTDGFQSFAAQGNAAGNVTLSTNPFGSSAPIDRTVVWVIGTSDSNTFTIPYSDTAKGCLVNSDATLNKGQVVQFMYVSAMDRFVELSRNF